MSATAVMNNPIGTTVGKTTIKVIRTFGTQNLCEIYSDYVAKQIREEVKKSRAENREANGERV